MGKQLTYEQIFFRFLKHHRAYSKYKRNYTFCLPHYKNEPNSCVSAMVGLGGFSWGQTPEGGAYWVDLSYKWQELCKSLNIGQHIYA